MRKGAQRKWLGKVPERCDICGKPLKENWVDGQTIFGPWANMCLSCHSIYGCGLGLGRGQKYSCKTLGKTQG